MPPVLLTADSPGLVSAFGPPQWGIFDQNGGPLLVANSVADIEYARDYKISDYPQEQGAFQSYNKVALPFQAKIGFYISTTRQQFLNSIDAAVKSLALVTVVTPEIRYASANLTHAGYSRTVRSGVTLIRVEVWAEEVRIVSGVVPSAPQSTNANSPTQSGQVQPIDTTQNPPPAVGGAEAAASPFAGNTATGSAAETPSTVGGSFVPDPNRTGSFSTIRNTDTFVDPNTGLTSQLNPDTTIPAGIPNATGGGASATTTDLDTVVRGITVIPF